MGATPLDYRRSLKLGRTCSGAVVPSSSLEETSCFLR